ncbi:hypothetical protein B4N89_40805 [Embleya scabrispora]|uniref:Uncharacterized protein n=1 Tax=Embleya scabrispora TaxID=159449 RepID=A0A1T3NJC7_9ACTN|nr:hypothetical protein B4N89_40805 [Embleya scabrispora]
MEAIVTSEPSERLAVPEQPSADEHKPLVGELRGPAMPVEPMPGSFRIHPRPSRSPATAGTRPQRCAWRNPTARSNNAGQDNRLVGPNAARVVGDLAGRCRASMGTTPGFTAPGAVDDDVFHVPAGITRRWRLFPAT